MARKQPVKLEAKVGNLVEFKGKSGGKFTGKVVKVFGDVYTIETSDQESRPVHNKYLLKILPAMENHS